MQPDFRYLNKDFPRMIDISAVKTDSTWDEVMQSVEAAKRYHIKCVFAMPLFTPTLKEMLADTPDVLLGGTAGFPSGEDTTATKVAATKELLQMGCDEIDIVIAVGALKSGKDQYVYDDIRAVREVVVGKPLKTILEVTCLTDDEIKRGAEIAVRAGANYVKTGTGWMPNPTTLHHVRLIRETIGDAAKIKAAGGVNSLEFIDELIGAGCSRFGLSYKKTINFLKQMEQYGMIAPET